VHTARLLLRVAGVLAGLAALAFTASFVVVLVTAQRDDRDPTDAIVVLGAAQYNGRPSPVLKARLDHAVALWRARVAPVVVVTGGRAAGDAESEAEVAGRYVREAGVPDAAVVVIAVGDNTATSMDSVAGHLLARDARRATLVSDPFHQARLAFEARRRGLEPHPSPTETSPISARPVVELEYLLAEALKLPLAWLRGWNR